MQSGGLLTDAKLSRWIASGSAGHGLSKVDAAFIIVKMPICQTHSSAFLLYYDSMPSKIVIVGAGFVGLPAARRLKARLGDEVDVLLIDPKDHFLFAPRLIDALAGDVEQDQIRTDLALIADRCDFRFHQGTVERVDRNRRIIVANGKRIPYDLLILSQGSRMCYFGIPGSEEHSVCLKQLADVYRIHERVHALVNEAKRAKDADEKRALLSFVVVGGGPSGVESIFALKRYVERHCDTHAPRLHKYLSFMLLEAGPQILNGFPPRIVHGAMEELDRNSITIHTGDAVSCVENTCVLVKKEKMPAALTVWAAGILPNIIPIEPEVHRDTKGCLITDRFLSIDPCIFAAGDAVTHHDKTVMVPKNAQTALKMSRAIVENAVRSLHGKSLLPFAYSSKGTILVTGRTGFVDTSAFAFKTRLAALIRDAFYRYRQWQITKQ